MLDRTNEKAKPVAADYAGALKGAVPLDVVNAAPPILPVEVDEAPKPKPARKNLCSYDRKYDDAGNLVSIEIRPLKGNAIVRVWLEDFKDKRCKVGIFTEPRRGRAFKSQNRK